MSVSGIIIPPPEIQNLADKTAKLFAERGPEIEELVKTNLTDDPKFSFLKYNDPYRPYFDQKVKEYKSGAAEGPLAIEEDRREGGPRGSQQKPPPESKYIYDCGSIGVLENDIIQHTAQFVAKNGQKFLIALTEREKHNPQFEFLKPTHNLFPYFTSLIDSYSRILQFEEKELELLQAFIVDKKAVLRSCSEVFEYESEAQMNRRRREELEEEERAQRAMIDWNDFIVVQTIEFDDDAKNYPAPLDFTAKDSADQFQFNKANVNPDYAFMYDASQVFASNGAKQNHSQMPNSPFVTVPDESLAQNKPQKPFAEPKNGHDKREQPLNEINVNLRIQNITAFGDLAGKTFSLQLNPAAPISQVISTIARKLKGLPEDCKLRSPEHDLFAENQSLASYGAYNGIVLELIR